MEQWKLWFVHLLPLCWSFDSEVSLEKTIRSEPDVTPLCTNSTLEPIVFVVCKIRTERNRGEECRLFYVGGRDFEQQCDSRFKLVEKNQTVFLHLSSLTAVDSGNLTCECSFSGGTNILHLNITVEDAAASYEWFSIRHLSSMFYYIVIGGPAAFVLVIGLILGCVLRKKHSRDDAQSLPPGLSVSETACTLDQNEPDDPNDPYTSLQEPESDVYETVFSVHHEDDTKKNSADNCIVTAHLDNQEADETDQVCEIYENL